MDARVGLHATLAASLALSAPAAAGEVTVYRCESAAGATVYSDQPCGAGTVLTLDVAGTRPPAIAGESQAPDAQRATRGTCPAPSTGDLPAAVSAAFASGDVNRLASLYHWTGLTDADARRMFGRFNDLLAQPLRNVGVGSMIESAAPAGYLDVANAPEALGHPDELWLELGPPQAPRQVRFRIVENAGCAWLRFG